MFTGFGTKERSPFCHGHQFARTRQLAGRSSPSPGVVRLTGVAGGTTTNAAVDCHNPATVLVAADSPSCLKVHKIRRTESFG